jgi:hypothetical protein
MNKNRSSQFLAPLLFPALVLAFAGCSSVKTHVDKGPVSAHTFSFLDTASRQAPAFSDNRKEAHALIQQALIKNLAAKGVSYVPSGGEVTVAYLVIVGNNATTTSLNGYFGYTEDSDALVSKVHKEQAINGDERAAFESGTLVIDILDPHTSKLLERRSIKAPILRDLTIENRATRVQAIVDQALSNVPISRPGAS